MKLPFYNPFKKNTDELKSEEGVSSKYLRHFVDVIARYPEAWAVCNNIANSGEMLYRAEQLSPESLKRWREKVQEAMSGDYTVDPITAKYTALLWGKLQNPKN